MPTWQTDFRDRSNEFFATVQSLKKKEGGDIQKRSDEPSKKSQFTQAASHIMSGIHSTAKKLEELTLLTRKTSLYLDQSERINQITQELKQDMQTLKGEIGVLNKFVASKSTANNINSSMIVDSLKAQLAKQSSSFVNVLKARTHSLKNQNQRRKHFESSKVMVKRKRNRDFSHFSHLLDDATPPTEKGEGDPTHAPKQQDTMVVLAEPERDLYLESRADALQNIERTICQIGDMYTDLADIVDRHAEVSIRINQNVTTTLDNVKGGYGELITYYDSVSSGQWLIIKVFFILLVFALFFIVFVA